jgi:hypothetical protein
MKERKRCSRRVYDGTRADFGGHPCQTNATVEVDGKWFCGKHSPEGVAKREAKFQERLKARQQADSERWEREKQRAKRAASYEKLVALLVESREGMSKDWIERRDALRTELGEISSEHDGTN